ncbi:hypothetical protein [Spirosoma sp. KUDC1026]|uniref:hypothetical protein n=1 Tax=Spirosoma sp. KUDC1026 TaxID=2745947 RepID=UPI00159B93CD|nr:hypothetical protein [Spirosoma sp. KUDC1026]QKZ15208.1 hypothetical protein HU175_22305 [Spirosoma sp. KUDC1026]
MSNLNLKAVRKFYGLSATDMSRICGFGPNQWRLYENGEASPNSSNYNLIVLVVDPYSFQRLLKVLSDVDRVAMGKRYDMALQKTKNVCWDLENLVEASRRDLVQAWRNSLKEPEEV